MKLKKILPVLLSVLFLTGAVFITSTAPKKSEKESRRSTAAVGNPSPELPDETRGLWVTYMTLDVENEADKRAAFEKKLDAITNDAVKGNFNTLIVQVRPFCDAIYPSEFFPWSHIISGTQGVDPGFDPLALIVEKCQQNGLYLHAWINPYRVATAQTPAELSDRSPVTEDEALGVEINGSIYLDPASEKTQKLIADGVRELAEKYDIDGIQFDDYFYPENCGDFDKAEYLRYLEENGEQISIEEFRKNNVSKMVSEAYAAAHEADSDILFGISPQGNLRNNDGLYADVEAWSAEEGYIDYICPQIYFSLDNPALTFEDCLSEWLSLKKHKGLRLFVGLSGYKAGTDADDGTWLDNHDILQTEIGILRQQHTDGWILYSYDSLHNEENSEEIQNVIRYLTTSAVQ